MLVKWRKTVRAVWILQRYRKGWTISVFRIQACVYECFPIQLVPLPESIMKSQAILPLTDATDQAVMERPAQKKDRRKLRHQQWLQSTSILAWWPCDCHRKYCRSEILSWRQYFLGNLVAR